MITPPARNSDDSITLPDGTVLTPPPHRHDDPITPPTRHTDGTLTLPDGTVVNPADRPAPRGHRRPGGS